MTTTISREQLKSKMDRGDSFYLVDALPEEYYRHSHLPGALNVPSAEVRELAPKLLPDKQKEIVTYCANPE